MSEIIDTINFTDADSSSQATAIVRVDSGIVGLSTFVVDGGECEIYMPADICNRLADALRQAALRAKDS